MKHRATKLSEVRVDLAAELDRRSVVDWPKPHFNGKVVVVTHTGPPIIEAEETTTHTSHMCRLWKAMKCPVGWSDSMLIRKAAARINELERELKLAKEASSGN